MFQIFTCLTTQHDWRLVLIAGLVCLLTSLVTISRLHRAFVTNGTTRLLWIAIAGAVAGCGIWATHFIAMLAYEPGVPVGYDVVLTTMSLLAGVAVISAGLATALYLPTHW